MRQYGKPLYKSVLGKTGSALTAMPPFNFHGVTARVFPLRANISSLTAFCDAYLNMDIPRSILHFQPSIPYVYLIILDYGKMAVDVGNRFWVSQREVSFAVPLERYKEDEDGRLVFQDFALVHPFIYVDDEWSLMTGREVYGWPKVYATIDADIDLWTTHPRSRQRLMTLSTEVFGQTYAGKRQEPMPLVEVHRQPAPTFTQIPPDPFNPFSLLLSIPNAVANSLSVAQDLFDDFVRLPIRGYEPTRSVNVLQEMLGTGFKAARVFLPEILISQFGSRVSDDEEGSSPDQPPELNVHNVNLKQFRDAENPNVPCYQALNYSTMGINRFNSGGFLGDINLLRGDPSGGYRITIHRHAAQPIIESLGLEMEAEWEAKHGGDQHVPAATLKPILPFWCDVEFHYGKGSPLCWRTQEASAKATNYWKAPEASDTPPSVAPDDGYWLAPHEWEKIHTDLESTHESAYNTARGAALQAIPGPFHYPDVTVRVFPLLADKQRLSRLCNEYLNEELAETGLRFEPFGTHVYLTVTSYGRHHGTMWSETNNIGSWKSREVAFRVPVKWYKDGELVSIATLSPFAFADNDTAVATDREIVGRPTVKASIDCPPGVWMEEAGPHGEPTLLTVKTETLPALSVGQEAEERTVLDIVQADVLAYNDLPGWRMVAQRWGEELAQQLERKTTTKSQHADEFKNLKALALEILTLDQPVNEIELKQYRDSSDPQQACYQALTKSEKVIDRIYRIEEIEDKVHIGIHAYPSIPIVETLGLKCKTVDSKGESVIQYLQPIRPFWMWVSMQERLTKNICRREGELWETPRHVDDLYLNAEGRIRAAIEEFSEVILATVDRPTENVQKSVDNIKREFAGPLRAYVMSGETHDSDDQVEGRFETQVRDFIASLQKATNVPIGVDGFADAVQTFVQSCRQLPYTQVSPEMLDFEKAVRDKLEEERDRRLMEGIALGKAYDARFFRWQRPELEHVPDALSKEVQAIEDAVERSLKPLEEEDFSSRSEAERRTLLKRVERNLTRDVTAELKVLKDAEHGLQLSHDAMVALNVLHTELPRLLQALSNIVAKLKGTLTLSVSDFPQRLKDKARSTQSRELLTRADAEKALETIDEPQMVIESILSAEWEAQQNPRWHQKKLQKPDFCVRRDSFGTTVFPNDLLRFGTAHGLEAFEGSWWHCRPQSHRSATAEEDMERPSSESRPAEGASFPERSETTLHRAASAGATDEIAAQLDAGADTDGQDEHGETALMAAAGADQLEAIKVLLDRGADLTIRDRKGRTALDWAVSEEAQAILVEAGAKRA